MEAFVQWALDPVRGNEEKYTVELIVETGMRVWHARHKTGILEDPEAREERNRQRKLNPAYVASYSEEELRKTAEFLPERKEWSHFPYSERPIRDLKAFQFLNLESLDLNSCEATDLSPIANLPKLRSLTFSSPDCSDFRALTFCKNLRELKLTFGVPWPEVGGLELLQDLEELHLVGNLLAFAPGTTWGKVWRGSLSCLPLAARTCGDLPILPACRFLTLAGADRLEGIERMSHLRNLVLNGPVRDYAPLAALHELTCLTVTGDKPRDVTPLIQLPKLQFAQFGEKFRANTPRDYSPLAEAPMLRELVVLGCPPVEMEVAAINAGLAHWDDVLLDSAAHPLSPLRMVVAPATEQPPLPKPVLDPEESDFVDAGVRACEGRWVAEHLHQQVADLTGNSHWGTITVKGENRTFYMEINAIEAVEIFPEVLHSIRESLARLRHEYSGTVIISLQTPHAKPTPAELEMEEHLQELQENEEFEQWRRDQEDYLDRLHRYELKKQEGGPIDPAEFTVPEPQPISPWAEEEEGEDMEEDDEDFLDEEEEDEDSFEDSESSLMQGEHPLADHYRLMAYVTLNEIWFQPSHRGIAVHLMRREPDLEFPG